VAEQDSPKVDIFVLIAFLQSKVNQSEDELTNLCSLIGGERVIFEWLKDSY